MQKYQEKSEFVFDSVDSLRYNLHKISLNRGGSNIDSPEWLKNKKATVNPKNNDDKSNYDKERENQVLLSMITDGKK